MRPAARKPHEYSLPDGAQTHLLSGELSRPLDTVVLPLGFQVDVEANAQTRDLIRQQLVSRAGSLKLIFEHVHFALHGLVNVERQWHKARVEKTTKESSWEKSSYSKIVVRVSSAFPFPAERQGEQRRDFWVAGIQHHGSIQTCWTTRKVQGIFGAVN